MIPDLNKQSPAEFDPPQISSPPGPIPEAISHPIRSSLPQQRLDLLELAVNYLANRPDSQLDPLILASNWEAWILTGKDPRELPGSPSLIDRIRHASTGEDIGAQETQTYPFGSKEIKFPRW